MAKSDKCFILHKSILLVVLLLLAGCTPVISRQVREQVRPDITFKEILNAPERYQGQMVILSGIIIDAKNTKEGTLFEILQSPAGFRGKPKDTDKSEGRFLVHNDSYLDLNIYTKGRSVTVAGQIEGKRVLPLGEAEYTYPLIRSKEIYLWPILRRHHPYSYYSFERYYWWRESLLHRCIIPKKSHATPKK